MASKKITVEVNVVENGKLKKITLEGEKARKVLGGLEKGAGATDRAMKGVAGATSNSTKAFAKQSQGLGGLVHAYATVAANAFALTAAFMALQKAADLQVLKSSMEIMDRASGTNLSGMAKALKEVTGGMITFEEAAKQAAIVSAAGFGRTELVELGKAARGASQALGRDFGDSMDRLVRGVVKAEPELLDELGIILRLDDASQKYAKTLGKNVTELSTYEKQVAVMNEVLDQANDKYGDIIESSATVNQFTRLQASATEILHTALGGLATVLSPIAGFLNDNSAALGTLMAVTALALGKMAIPMFASLGSAIEGWGATAEKNFDAQLIRQGQLVNSYKDTSSQAHKFADAQGDALKRTLSTYKNITPKIRKLIKEGVGGAEFTKAADLAIKQSITQAETALDAGQPIKKGLLLGGTRAELEQLKALHKSANTAIVATHIEASAKVKGTWAGAMATISTSAARASLAISGAGVAAVAGWKAAGSVTLLNGFLTTFKNIGTTFEGIGATADSAGVAVTGFTKAAARGALVVRVIGGALLSAFNILGMLYLGFEALSFIWNSFKSDKVLAQEKAIKGIEDGLEGVAESAAKYQDTIEKAGDMSVKSMAEAIKQADMLKNAYTQLSDTASGEFGKVDAVISRNMRSIENLRRAQKRADKENLAGAAEAAELRANRGDRQFLPSIDESIALSKSKRGGGISANLSEDIAAAEKEAENLKGIFAGIHKFIQENPVEIGLIIDELPEGDIKKSIERLESATVPPADMSVEEYSRIRNAIVNAMKAGAAEANSLHTALNKVLASSSEIPKAIHSLLVPNPDAYSKMSNDIKEASDALISLSKNSKATDPAVIEAAARMQSTLESLGMSQEAVFSLMTGADPAAIAFAATNAWGLMRTALVDVEGTLGNYNAGLISVHGNLDKVAAAEYKLASISRVQKGKAQDTSAIASAELAVVNAKIQKEERSLALKVKSLQQSKDLATTDAGKLLIDQQILDAQNSSNAVILEYLTTAKNLGDLDDARLLSITARLAKEKETKQLLQARAVIQEQISAALKVQANLNKTEDARFAAMQESQTSTLSYYTSILALRNKETGQYAQQAVLRRQVMQRRAQELVAAQGQARIEKEINRLMAERIVLNLNPNAPGNADKSAALKAQIDALKIQQEGLAGTTDLESDLLAREQREELLEFPSTMAEGWNSAMATMAASTKSLGDIVAESLVSGVNSLTDGLVEMAQTGDFSARAFKRMAASIILDLGKMIAKRLIYNAISGMLGGAGGSMYGGMGGTIDTMTFAKGGIMTSNGKADLQSYAKGGIAKSPQLALYGEGSMNEAFVPLPDGKTIPVTMSGGGGTSEGTNNNVVVNITMSSDGSAKEESSSDSNQIQKFGKMVSQAVQQEIIQQQRPGGLLSRR